MPTQNENAAREEATTYWHPHLHALVTCSAFTPTGEFMALPAFEVEALLHAWQNVKPASCGQ